MMMKNHHIPFGTGLIAIMIWIGAFLSSCESVLFIELEQSDKLIVLNGAISNDSTVVVQVSRTRHILDNAPVIPLDNASVRLFQGSTLIEELNYAGNGFFRAASFTPDIGVSYTLEVEHQGFPAISAQTVIPGSVGITSIDTATLVHEFVDPYFSFTTELLQFDIALSDPPGEENYYLLNVKAERSYTQWRDTSVVIIDSLYYGNQWNYYPRDSSYQVGDIIPFTAYPNIGSEDIIVEAIAGGGILFSDQLIDGKNYTFRGMILLNELESADSAQLDFRLHSISESYYKYLKSRQKHYETKENYLAVPVIVYTNVQEGTGFFGGFSSDVVSITTFVPEYRWEYWYYED